MPVSLGRRGAEDDLGGGWAEVAGLPMVLPFFRHLAGS
jgi:hypothetical protein